MMDFADEFQGDLTGKTSHRSNLTSTIPFVQYWKGHSNGASMSKIFAERIPEIENNEINFSFEYPTQAEGAKGGTGASKSDGLIECGDARIAIEAKFTEYWKEPEKSIKDWAKTVSDPKTRISQWCKMIGRFADDASKIDEQSEIQYQFLHRTASACGRAESQVKKAVVWYQLFYVDEKSPEISAMLEKWKARKYPDASLPCDCWKSKMEELVENMKKWVKAIAPNENLRFFVQKIEVTKFPSFRVSIENLYERMKNGEIFYEFGKEEIEELR